MPSTTILDADYGHDLPEAKKAKVDDSSVSTSSDGKASRSAFALPQRLLSTTNDKRVYDIPPSLLKNDKTGNNLSKLKGVFDSHGFRTSIVMSPRPALAVYKDSCHVTDEEQENSEFFLGKEFLIAMLGLHDLQARVELLYTSSVKNLYCLLLFCRLLRSLFPQTVESEELKACIKECEQLSRSVALFQFDHEAIYKVAQIAGTANERVSKIIQLVSKFDPGIRVEQLRNEYSRIVFLNSTLSNAYLQLFLDQNNCTIKEIFFKQSHKAEFEHVTIFLYDPNSDLDVAPRFTYMPSLAMMLKEGPEGLSKEMVKSFWSHLCRCGYSITTELQSFLGPELEKFFLFGLVKDVASPLELSAHFTPRYPLSIYFHGESGSGKSSLAMNFSPALNAVINDHVEPEILVRFVKQNLNKRTRDLEMDFEIRPDNNDMSLMSLIQGRRMTMGQLKPGLVVVNLEGMPHKHPEGNLTQLETVKLISRRFSGSNGEHQGVKTHRDLKGRGMSGDANVIVLFTSCYELETPAMQLLQQLDMFSNLKNINVEPVSGIERRQLANTYLRQCIADSFCGSESSFTLAVDVPATAGDVRPLMRGMRMLNFYLYKMISSSVELGGTFEVSILQKDSNCWINACNKTVELKVGSRGTLLPLSPRVYDLRTGNAVEGLNNILGQSFENSELSLVIDFWLSRTLAPAVIISDDYSKIAALLGGLGALREVSLISNIDAGEYKMMRSLYDSRERGNLRDDILKFGRGAMVAVELKCPTVGSQLCICELIEDSPSMTAFTSDRSALRKDGLLFGVFVNGDITPELRSRASLII